MEFVELLFFSNSVLRPDYFFHSMGNLIFQELSMNWKEIIKTMCFSTLLIAVFTANANETHIQKFVNKYCIDCHGEKKSKASVRFDNADFKFEKHASIYFWQDTLDVLNVGEMPPEDEKQPSNEELKNVIGEITVNLQIARKKLEATGGVISMRHLNRREYAGSIQDLLEFQFQLKNFLLIRATGSTPTVPHSSSLQIIMKATFLLPRKLSVMRFPT